MSLQNEIILILSDLKAKVLMIDRKLDKQSTQIACLQTKWRTVKWMLATFVGVSGTVIALFAIN